MPRKFSGPRLREARRAAGLTADQLAQRIGRNMWTVYQYEKATAVPSVPTLGAIADVLNVTTDSLFDVEAVADAHA